VDEKIELKVLNVSTSKEQASAYALVLVEVGGNRQLPIIIGPIEAQAIVFKLRGLNAPRPLTHDLFYTFAETFDVQLREVVIYKAQEGVFYSYLYFVREEIIYRIDSRTSDAVALAIRYGCPIYTFESIMSEEGLFIVEGESPGKMSSIDTLESLKTALERAIQDEDYELASLLRDKIRQRENEKEKKEEEPEK